MSLLPKALQFRDEALSLPLGEAKVRPVDAKPDPNAWFEAEGRRHAKDRPPRIGKPGAFTEALATPPSTEKPPKFKVGDRVRWSIETDAFQSSTITKLIDYDGKPAAFITDEKNGDGLLFLSEISLIPSEPKEADGWIAFNWRTDRAPPDWAKRLYDIRVCSAGTLKEFKGQRHSFASSEVWHVTHYRPSQKQ